MRPFVAALGLMVGSAIALNPIAINLPPVGSTHDVTVGAALPADWSVSRASNATYFDSAGVLQTAANDVARIAYDPAGGNVLRGLLLEPAATELLVRTEDLGDSAWTTDNLTITTDAAAAPDGATSADLLMANAGSGFHSVKYPYGGALPTPGILSFFAKKGSTDYLFANFGGGAKNIRTVIDLNAGTMAPPQVTSCTLGIYDILNVGGGWYLCYLQSPDLTPTVACEFTPYNSATVPANAPEAHTWTAAGETCYLWGVNFIQSSALGSYIKATTATAARALETLTISNLNAKGFSDGEAYPAIFTYEDDTTLEADLTVSGGAIQITGVQAKAIKAFSMSAGTGAIGYDYLVNDDASWTAAFTLSDATLAGKVIAIAPGTYTGKTITNRPATQMRVIALDPVSPPKLEKCVLDTAQNILCENIWFTSPDWGSSPVSCLRYISRGAGGYLRDIKFRDCEFVGNYRGIVDNPAFDPDDPQLPEFACIIPVFTAGVLTGLQPSQVHPDDGTPIDLDFVGDLVADGTGYSFIFYNQGSGGVQWPGGATLPTATFDVVGGFIQNMTISNGGSGAVVSGTSTPADGVFSTGNGTGNVSWAGKSPISAHMPLAVSIDSSTGGLSSSSTQVLHGTFRYENCRVRQCFNGFKHQAAEVQETVGCTIDSVYMDPYAFSIAEGNQHILHLNNHTQGLFSAAGHPNDPHPDAVLQLWPETSTSGDAKRLSDINVTIQGNSCIMSSWSNAQGIFIRLNYSQGTIPSCTGIISHNIVLGRVEVNAIQVDTTKDLIVWRNLVMHGNPADTDTANLDLDPGVVSGAVLVGKNISEKFSSGGGAGYKDTTKYPNAVVSGAAHFASYAVPSSRAELLSAIELSGAAQWTNANFGPLGGSHDFDALVPQASDIPCYVHWPIKTDQALSSTTTSDWAAILGPDGSFAWTGEGNVQFADDAAGTNASVAAMSGDHVHDNLARKYVRIDAVNSGAGRTAVASNFTLNGAASPFYSISATLTTYPTVDNGGTEYSRWATNGSVTGIAKGILASRRMNDANVNDMCAFGGVSTSTFRQNMNLASDQARLQMLASNIHWARFNIGAHPTGEWLDEIHMFDWTKDPAVDGKTAVAKMVRNYVPQLLDESGSAFNTIGGTRTCTLDNLLGTTASKGLGFFATSGGAGISDSQGEWMWAWFGQAGDSMPDITDPFIASKFGADHFGADGAAGGALPTPQIFFHADANGPGEWNAGLTNRGSLGGTVSKISAGAYA